jgi:hypothetical protein
LFIPHHHTSNSRTKLKAKMVGVVLNKHVHRWKYFLVLKRREGRVSTMKHDIHTIFLHIVSKETILFWLWPYVLWPLITVHKCAETIQGRKLFNGGNYMKKYDICFNAKFWNMSLHCGTWWGMQNGMCFSFVKMFVIY